MSETIINELKESINNIKIEIADKQQELNLLLEKLQELSGNEIEE